MPLSDPKNIKQQICSKIFKVLDKKLEELQKNIASAQESRASETKSSAGDKFETGREMIQTELLKVEAQLHKNLQLKNQILNINVSRDCQKAEFGALVSTNQGSYFLAVAVGKISLPDNNYVVLSLNSPLGKVLKDRVVGESFQFQGKEYHMLEIA